MNANPGLRVGLLGLGLVYITTYALSSTVLPVILRAKSPFCC